MSRACSVTIGAITVCYFIIAAAGEDNSGRDNVHPYRNWGGDHIASGFPDYVTGDECLFCHREIGQSWPTNRHQLTLRPVAEDDIAITTLQIVPDGKRVAADAHFLLGQARLVRFL